MTKKVIEHLGLIKRILREFGLLIELLAAWWKGRYRVIPYGSILIGLGALAYFFFPADLVPDFIPVFGFIDDAFIFGLLFNQIHRDLMIFEQWKLKQFLN